MKSWPEDGDWISYTDLIDPVREALAFTYKLVRKNSGKDIPYGGYDTPSSAPSCPDPEKMLTAVSQKLEREQGRSTIDIILGIVFRLGYEQGYRVRELEPMGLHRLKRLKKEKKPR